MIGNQRLSVLVKIKTAVEVVKTGLFIILLLFASLPVAVIVVVVVSGFTAVYMSFACWVCLLL